MNADISFRYSNGFAAPGKGAVFFVLERTYYGILPP